MPLPAGRHTCSSVQINLMSPDRNRQSVGQTRSPVSIPPFTPAPFGPRRHLCQWGRSASAAPSPHLGARNSATWLRHPTALGGTFGAAARRGGAPPCPCLQWTAADEGRVGHGDGRDGRVSGGPPGPPGDSVLPSAAGCLSSSPPRVDIPRSSVARRRDTCLDPP